jgi:hypothetical protein
MAEEGVDDGHEVAQKTRLPPEGTPGAPLKYQRDPKVTPDPLPTAGFG